MINQHPIFLGGERKTFDSLNKHYPKIFELYKQQKAQDWSEDEFPLNNPVLILRVSQHQCQV